MRHLYLKLYVALVLAVMVSAVLFALIAHISPLREENTGKLPSLAARALWRRLPDPQDSRFKPALAELAREFSLRLEVIHEAKGSIARSSSGDALEPRRLEEGWQRAPGGPLYLVQLEGPYWLAVRDQDSRTHAGRVAKGVSAMLGLALILALACYPIARAMTRRLERLETAVEAWGTGDLRRRVPVDGKDEIASLADSFNRAAAKIEGLVTAQKSMLASASHEFRSPLARIRVALELMAEQSSSLERQQLADKASRDVEELDALVQDVLEAARADALQGQSAEKSELDFAAIIREEAAKTASAQVTAPPALILRGDARLLRRLVRNLVENAERHAAGSSIEIILKAGAGSPELSGAELVVQDRGPGVAEPDRERIFLPFFRPAGHRESQHGSVGLGLALVKQIAEQHGGSVHYAPREGGGARFLVRLGAKA